LESLQIAEGQAFNVLGARIPNWSGWLASIVVDEFGNHVGADGTSKTIANDLDLQLLMALRSKCSVIVTTGATARAEKYKSSRFAPIAFITKNQNSLSDVPAVISVGTNPNIFLESSSDIIDFVEFGTKLSRLGHTSFLFEGGPSTLQQLVDSGNPMQLVLSIINGGQSAHDAADHEDLQQVLYRVLAKDYALELADDFIVGPNRITRWVKQGS
jgi:riboflavin biosynthesis pyrimidine reductase